LTPAHFLLSRYGPPGIAQMP